MAYISVADAAKRWNLSERSVRNYCAIGKIPNAVLAGKTWQIPEDAEKPKRTNAKVENALLSVLREEKKKQRKGGIYHKVQIDLTYNSNHIEGSRLTHDQTRYIFETNTIGFESGAVNVDDVVETANHFRCIDMVIDNAMYPLSETLIKRLHLTLKNGTSDSRKDWFAVGEYKRVPNEVGGRDTTAPEKVEAEISELLSGYNAVPNHTLEQIIAFHHDFECIHPFQDGNGRIGRLILFKECLKNNIVPFIIEDDLKMFYYRGLHEWNHEHGYLVDTCLTAQDRFKAYLDYFRIPYRGTVKIKVMYRAQCLAAALGYGPEYDAENIDEPTLIISISSTDDKLPLIMNEANNENIRHIEYLQFDDIDTAESVHGLKPMSDEDAEYIVDAFLQYVDGVSQIIVHCDAGYSRSPAVAAALAKEFFGHDYCINNHVYTTLLKQLSERKILK